jgi:flagellar basal-body rod protein FlgB
VTDVLSIIDSGTGALLNLALEAAAMRQQAIAHNIANANTPGYRRITVSFEDQLAAQAGAERGPARAPAYRYAEGGSAGERVALDMELAQLAETSLHHQALLKALHQHFALLGLAINEGKR